MFLSLLFFSVFCFLFSEFGYAFSFLFSNSCDVFFDDDDDSWIMIQYGYLGLLFNFFPL